MAVESLFDIWQLKIGIALLFYLKMAVHVDKENRASHRSVIKSALWPECILENNGDPHSVIALDQEIESFLIYK